MGNVKEKSVFLIILKVLYGIIYGVIAGFMIWSLIDVAQSLEQSMALLGLVIVLIYGSIGFAFAIILAIVGLIVSIVKKKGEFNVISFIVALLLPIITDAVFIILTQALSASI